MSELLDFIGSIAEHIGAEFSSHIQVCKPLAGLIETTDIAAIHAKTPAIYVASVGSGKTSMIENGQKDINVYLLAYILVVNPDSVARERSALELVDGLLNFVPCNRWNRPNAFPAADVESADLHGLSKGFKPDVTTWRTSVSALSRASDLYGGDDPVSHLALWAVSWEQTLRIGKLVQEESITPERIIGRYDDECEETIHDSRNQGAA